MSEIEAIIRQTFGCTKEKLTEPDLEMIMNTKVRSVCVGILCRWSRIATRRQWRPCSPKRVLDLMQTSPISPFHPFSAAYSPNPHSPRWTERRTSSNRSILALSLYHPSPKLRMSWCGDRRLCLMRMSTPTYRLLLYPHIRIKMEKMELVLVFVFCINFLVALLSEEHYATHYRKSYFVGRYLLNWRIQNKTSVYKNENEVLR